MLSLIHLPHGDAGERQPGLALLLLFVSLSSISAGQHNQGAMTIWIAHITFTAAYVTVIIRSNPLAGAGSIGWKGGAESGGRHRLGLLPDYPTIHCSGDRGGLATGLYLVSG